MSKTLTYKGTLAIGTQDKIKLSTLQGKVGYRLKRFDIMSTAPGTTEEEIVAKIYKNDQTGNITPLVDLTDANILAVVYYQEHNSAAYPPAEKIIMDKEVFNQDIFVTADSANSSTKPVTYYIEMEAMNISDLEATYLTLQNIRTITS